MAYCLRLSLIIFLSAGVFASIAYHVYFPILAALIFAFSKSAGPVIQSFEEKVADKTSGPKEFLPQWMSPAGAAAI